MAGLRGYAQCSKYTERERERSRESKKQREGVTPAGKQQHQPRDMMFKEEPDEDPEQRRWGTHENPPKGCRA